MSTSAQQLASEAYEGRTPAAGAAPHETSTGLDNRKMAFWLFLGSECMFFGSLLITYLVYQGKSVVGPYPQDLLNIPLTSISTFVLLMSSLTMVLAVAVGHRRDRSQTSLWLGATALLGLVFLGFQVYEFSHFVHEGLTLARNLFGSSFYVLTGIHGTHVGVGILWIVALLFNNVRDRLREPGIVVEIAGLYWHFVDVVWIVIFTVVYLIGAEIRSTAAARPCCEGSFRTMEGLHSESVHVSPWAYIKVAVVLAAITAVEVAVFYVDLARPGLMVTVLVLLSAAKFLLVAMYFMHLRFDHRLFTYVFAFGLAVSLVVAAAVLAMH